MKLNPFFNLLLLFKISLVFFILISSKSFGKYEEEIKDISSKLRCMTCQNQTVYSSDTEFSLKIKKIIREKLENKETKKEIIDFLIYRYGEYILFEPKINKQNIFLWMFPFLILAVSLVFFLNRLRKNT